VRTSRIRPTEGGRDLIYSMTGYGKAESASSKARVIAEVRSVNHRYLEVSVRLPKSLGGYEGEVEKIVKKRLRRGHVYVSISLERGTEEGGISINPAALGGIYRELARAAKREGIPGEIDINTLLSLPDVLAAIAVPPDSNRLWTLAKKALSGALRNCIDMRKHEGEALVKDISKRVKRLERLALRIEKREPALKKKAFERARRRVEKLLEQTAVLSDTRWAAEVAMMAERSDITEEIIRLKSHIAQFRKVMRAGGEVSKKMTFLLQEMHREATTMGNKSVDASVIRDCLEIKEEVEKIREQVQNLE